MPMTDPVSTWAMLGRELTVRELVEVGDAIVHIPRDGWGRPQPDAALGNIAELHACLKVGPRPGATAKLDEAAGMIRVGSDSVLETDYRLDAASAGLPVPLLDQEIRSSDGRLLGRSEIVYEDYRVIVEIEGDHHRTSRRQWDRDIEKYHAYAAEDWQVVRLTSRHIKGPNPSAVGTVSQALRRRGWQP
jgi:hypothetical protein